MTRMSRKCQFWSRHLDFLNDITGPAPTNAFHTFKIGQHPLERPFFTTIVLDSPPVVRRVGDGLAAGVCRSNAGQFLVSWRPVEIFRGSADPLAACVYMYVCTYTHRI